MKQEFPVIDSFKGQYEMFSNFYPAIIEWNTMIFQSVEHAYVASKSNSFMFWRKISQMGPHTAGKAKREGKNISLRKDWNVVKLSFMRNFLTRKFNQDPFKQLLLSTEDVTLIEGNYWHDNYWGNCKCDKCKNIPGQNQLGKMLMKIRGKLYENINHR